MTDTTPKQPAAPRRNILERFLGAKGKDTETGLLQLARELDAAGVVRKEQAPEQVDATKAMLTDLRSGMGKLLGKAAQNVPDDLIDEMVSMALTKLIEANPHAAVDAAADPDVLEALDPAAAVDPDKPDDDDETKPYRKELAGVIALNDQLMADMDALVGELQTSEKARKERDLATEKALAAIESRMQKLEAQLRLQPRASQADNTRLAPGALPDVEKELARATTKRDPIFGTLVETP